MRMEEGLDTGPMLLKGVVPLGPRSTTAELHDALSAMGAELILRALDEDPPAVPQPEEGATYAPKLTKADGLLDWTQPAAALDARVRAMNPWPGAYFPHRGEVLRVLAAEPADGSGVPPAPRPRRDGRGCPAARLSPSSRNDARLMPKAFPGAEPPHQSSARRG